MGHFKVNQKDIFFILKEQLQYGSIGTLDRYKGLNEKTFDMLVTEAINFARGVVDPLQEIGEKHGLKYENGKVACPPEFREAFKQYGQDGWIAAARDPEYGGQGFPNMMRIVINDMMYGACQAFNMAPSLTHGAAHLIETFGSRELKERFVPKMFDGTWAGTMCLTEPDAGSNLAGLQTTAYPQGDHYKIKGTKIFISWGDHDLTENIIHLVIARIEGAPEGVKGISLFVVPKMRVNPDGSIEGSNDVLCGGVEDKLGLHSSPTCVLNFGGSDDCVGYLCGEANRGLAHMFQMMNAARINTGVSGMTLGQYRLSKCARICQRPGAGTGHRRTERRRCADYRSSGCPPHAAVDESDGGRYAFDDIYRCLLAGSRPGTSGRGAQAALRRSD